MLGSMPKLCNCSSLAMPFRLLRKVLRRWEKALFTNCSKCLKSRALDFKHFEQLVKSAFSQRRKTLRNNLKGIASDEQLQSLGIDPSIRSERLTVGEFVAISNLLTQTSS